MFKKVLMLMAIVLVSAASNLQAGQISCSWIGCDDGLWSDPSNWSCGMVPDNGGGNTFIVTIDASSCPNEVDVGLQQDRTIDQLDCYGEVDLENWAGPWERQVELHTLYGLTNHGELDIDEINIRGNITNTTGATLGLDEDKFIHDGNLYNQAGAMIEIGDEVNLEDGNIDNSGVIRIIPSSFLVTEHTLHNTGQINVYGGDCGADKIFDNNSTGVITGFGVLHGGADVFRNKGKIYAFGGSLLVGSFGAIINSGLLANKPSASLHLTYIAAQGEDVNNNGTIEVNAGGGVVFDCNLVNEPNAVIELNGGTLAASTITQSADANFAGFGGITGDVFIDPNGIIKLTGPTNIVGDVNIPAGATLEVSGGQTFITGDITCAGTIRLTGGTLDYHGVCDCNDCDFEYEAGAPFYFDINGDGIVNFEDFAYFALSWLKSVPAT